MINKNIRIVAISVLSISLVLGIVYFLDTYLENNHQSAEITKAFTQVDASNEQAIDSYIESISKKHPYMGSILLAKDGKLLVSKGYGLADIGKGVPNSSKTRFIICSITKQFTALAIMQLQEKGLLDVNDTLSKFLPDFPRGEEITIHQLLCHTSGLSEEPIKAVYKSRIAKDRNNTTDEYISLFKRIKLNFEPGTGYEYSNPGYDLLGVIIEKVSGMSFENYISKYILKPLDMMDSGYSKGQGSEENHAIGYRYGSTLQPTGYFDGYASGGLYSTVEDLYRWDRALYTDIILSKDSIELMYKPYASDPQSGYKYGYGFMLRSIAGHKSVMHTGGYDGFRAIIIRFIEEDAVIIMLCNNDITPFLTEASLNELASILFE